jgi:hypothetical protein
MVNSMVATQTKGDQLAVERSMGSVGGKQDQTMMKAQYKNPKPLM